MHFEDIRQRIGQILGIQTTLKCFYTFQVEFPSVKNVNIAVRSVGE